MKTQIKEIRPLIVLVFSSVVVFIVLGVWWLLIGEITFIHYPNSYISKNAGCGEGAVNIEKSWGMITRVKCFETSDSDQVVSNWYRKQKWLGFGERMIFPNVQIFGIRFEQGREFLIKNQVNSPKIVIVQQLTYRYTFMNNSH